MTSNEIAFAAVVSSGVVGALGIGIGGVTGWRDRASRSLEAQRDREHERRLAHEARTEEARRAFYIDVVIFLNRWLRWVDDEMTTLQESKLTSAPPPPAADFHEVPEERFRMTAQMTAFGTPRVADSLEQLIDAFQKFRADELLHRENVHHTGWTAPATDSSWKKLVEEHGELQFGVTTIQRFINDRLVPPPYL